MCEAGFTLSGVEAQFTPRSHCRLSTSGTDATFTPDASSIFLTPGKQLQKAGLVDLLAFCESVNEQMPQTRQRRMSHRAKFTSVETVQGAKQA